jgi:hypothetical protein
LGFLPGRFLSGFAFLRVFADFWAWFFAVHIS